MIELINVSKYYPTDFGRHYVFQNVSLVLPIDKSVGVLGPNGAGKSTFLRLIGGADIPSEGTVLRTGRISPPMGLTPGLQGSLTAGENARFAGRVFGLPRDEINNLIEYVRQLANIGKYFDMPVGTYSAGMKQRVSFAINMSMSFDYYLFDEIGAGGDREFRTIAKRMVQERLKTSKFIITSHRVDELVDICDSGIVIQNGELTFYDDIKDALAAYGEREDDGGTKRARRKRRKAENVSGETVASLGADAAGSAAGTEQGEDRKARREKRRLKRKLKKAKDVPMAGIPAVPEAGTAEAAPAGKDEKRDAREKKRLKRKLKKSQDTSATSLAAVPETAPAAEDEQHEARREQRRLKRKLKKQQDTPVAGIAAGPAEAGPAAEDEQRKARREKQRLKRKLKKTHGAPVEGAEAAPAEAASALALPVADDEDRKARREQRRLERKLKKQEHTPVVDTAAGSAEALPAARDEDRKARREQRRLERKLKKTEDTPLAETAAAAAEAEPAAQDQDFKARREQRRLKREQKKQLAAVAEDIPEPVAEDQRSIALTAPRREDEKILAPTIAAATADPVPVTPISVFQPPREVPASQERRSSPPPFGTAPFAKRLKPQPPAEPAAPPPPQALAPPVEQHLGKAPDRMGALPGRELSSKQHLIERARRSQERAQSAAARAADLLLQLIGDRSESGRSSNQLRALLVSAAQRTAAFEAGLARQMLERITSDKPTHESAPTLRHPAAGAETGSSTATGTNPRFRLTPPATHQD